MLTKNCRIILDTILALGEEHHFESYRIVDLSDRTGISFPHVLAACKELDQDGFASLQITHLRNGQNIPEAIVLTELGIHYKDFLNAKRNDYFKDKIIDFLALVIAFIALLKSFEAELLGLLQK